MSDHHLYQHVGTYIVVDNYLDEIKECSDMFPSKIKEVVEEGRIKAVHWISFSDQIVEFCPCADKCDGTTFVLILSKRQNLWSDCGRLAKFREGVHRFEEVVPMVPIPIRQLRFIVNKHRLFVFEPPHPFKIFVPAGSLDPNHIYAWQIHPHSEY
jgi:hypothetical protein